MKKPLVIETFPASIGDDFGAHVLEQINSLDYRLEVKESLWLIFKAFSEACNASFRSYYEFDANRVLYHLYQEYIQLHPDRQLYVIPQRVLNGSELSKLIDPSGKSVGRTNLFRYLRRDGYFYGDDYPLQKNSPVLEYVQRGYFVENHYRARNNRIYEVPLFTPLGVTHLIPWILNTFYHTNIM